MNKLLRHTYFIFVIILYFTEQTQAQKVRVEMDVRLNDIHDSTYFIKNADVFLLVEKDTISKGKTDKNGNYHWNGELAIGSKIRVITAHRFYSSSENLTLEINLPTSFVFELQLVPLATEFLHPPVFSIEGNEIITDFDSDYWNHQFRHLDQFCIEFLLFQLPNESVKLAKKRIKIFSHYLAEHGMDMRTVQYNPNFMVLDCTHNDDCRPKFEGIIKLLESNCNN